MLDTYPEVMVVDAVVKDRGAGHQKSLVTGVTTTLTGPVPPEATR